MIVKIIENGFFKLDGGAMFGVVPKSIWNKLNPSDESNLCTWATRSLLLEIGKKLILVDTGLGNKQNDSFFKHFHMKGDTLISENIKKAGYSPDEITDVVLTHLHFDHCGGAVSKDINDSFIPTFKNAIYWSNEAHWNWATEPNPREKASFLKENILPLKESGQLKFIDASAQSPWEEIKFNFVDGHTEKMMLPEFQYKGNTYVFTSDLIPSFAHIPLPYVMAYDTRPLLAMQEKEEILKKALAENKVLIFQHDPVNQCATLQNTDKGIRPYELFSLD